MASAVYPKAKQELLKGNIDMEAGDVRAVLIDTGVYTYNAAHQFYSDLSGIVGTESPVLGTKTFVDGVFDSANTTFTAVTGNTAEAVVLFLDTGNPAADNLIAYIDSGTGLPFTPNGSDLNTTVGTPGWFTL